MAKHHGHKSHHHGHHKKEGGRIGLKAAGNPDVFKEAEGKEPYAKGDLKKHGGKVKHHRAKGGHVDGHHMDGHPGHHHQGKKHHGHKHPGRKRGGGVGADRSPLSTAHRGHLGAGHGSSEPKDTYGGTPP